MVTDKKMLNVQDTMLVVVDVQSRLVPAIAGADKVLRNIVRIIKGAHILSLPVLGVEQYPRGLGPTVPEIRSLFNEQPIEKISFAATDEEMFVERLKDCNRKQVLLCGMEAHVCVYQSALGLMDVGYEVHLLADAIGSRDPGNKGIAVQRLLSEGVKISSVEMALFELLRTSSTATFKQISELVK